MIISLSSVFTLESIYNKFRDKPLPIKTAYKISKLNQAITQDLEFYRRHLQDILDRYAERDENGNFIVNETQGGVKIKQECLELCSRDINELETMELDINCNQKFTLDELAMLDLTLAELDSLTPFIEE